MLMTGRALQPAFQPQPYKIPAPSDKIMKFILLNQIVAVVFFTWSFVPIKSKIWNPLQKSVDVFVIFFITSHQQFSDLLCDCYFALLLLYLYLSNKAENCKLIFFWLLLSVLCNIFPLAFVSIFADGNKKSTLYVEYRCRA